MKLLTKQIIVFQSTIILKNEMRLNTEYNLFILFD